MSTQEERRRRLDSDDSNPTNIKEAVAQACKEPTLADALSHICVWETERVVRQAIRWYETGESTASHGGGWDTCFKVALQAVMEQYGKE